MKTTVFPVVMKHQDHCPPEWQIPPAAPLPSVSAVSSAASQPVELGDTRKPIHSRQLGTRAPRAAV